MSQQRGWRTGARHRALPCVGQREDVAVSGMAGMVGIERVLNAATVAFLNLAGARSEFQEVFRFAHPRPQRTFLVVEAVEGLKGFFHGIRRVPFHQSPQ